MYTIIASWAMEYTVDTFEQAEAKVQELYNEGHRNKYAVAKVEKAFKPVFPIVNLQELTEDETKKEFYKDCGCKEESTLVTSN